MIVTNALVPVVKVTDGPTVAKSVNVVDVVDSEVSIMLTAFAGVDAVGVAHFNPVAVLESAVRTVLLAPTARRATVSAAVAAIRSPLASTILGLIAEPAVM